MIVHVNYVVTTCVFYVLITFGSEFPVFEKLPEEIIKLPVRKKILLKVLHLDVSVAVCYYLDMLKTFMILLLKV